MNPKFEEIIPVFRKFLEQQGCPGKIVWVAPEHTMCCGRAEWKIFENECVDEEDIKLKYQDADDKKFGVRFCALCVNDETSYCYLIVPTSELDADYKLLTYEKVKLSVPAEMPHASILRRGFRASWYQTRESIKFKEWKELVFRID
ncbi:hypothetical protein UNDKW_2122 [Undibacterium sp. KW1]|uniref:hypothetical protein n=1 Tax=Undibacterium sp. KW1 TaxID=2058624 RepID=UPI001331F3F6|nr:hypothetical protein [Undibacterium sp. KW1]BBB60395.1 hypothetical protein UNDKW_2122 [Undibacterium sp. KW1]